MRKWWTSEAFRLDQMKMCAAISENKGTFAKSWGVLPKSSLVLRRRWAVSFTKARRKGRKVRCAGRDATRVSTDKGDEERKKRRKS